jgi:hypothetical protein
MARQDLEFIATALGDAVESARFSVRLQHGAKLRAAIYRAMAQGEAIDHYRVQWLGASGAKIVQFARNLCKEFDEAHPDDMASAYDLGDILRIAASHINDALPQEGVQVGGEPEPEKNDTPT